MNKYYVEENRLCFYIHYSLIVILKNYHHETNQRLSVTKIEDRQTSMRYIHTTFI
jgi:hypothetical protein